MTREEVKSIVRGITDKIEATTDIDDWAEFWGFTRDDYEEFLEMPIKLLEQEPSINSQPKTGHWTLQPSNKEQGERDFIWWKCSECGQVIYSETEKDRREYHAFCGRCGAKMIEPQKGSEE